MADDTPYSMPYHFGAQHAWAVETFGPGERWEGLTAHIRKECDEIEEAPTPRLRAEEAVDVFILAADLAMRALAADGDQRPGVGLAEAYARKMEANRLRRWPDWRKAAPGQPIEHDRGRDAD